jgi:SSS family solute:Na+ symporter
MDTTAIVLIVYLLAMFFIAWYFSRKESVEAYFVNQRETSLWLMTFSTVATVVGAGATVAIVAEVYNTGISYGVVLPISFIVGMFILGLLAKKIKEIGDQYNAHTIVDFFEKRFGRKNKILAGWLQIFLLIIWIGVQAVAIASLASVLTGFDYLLALFFSAAVTILYTAIGGLKVDIITDFVQFWIILLVFIAMAIVGYQSVGGFNNLLAQLPAGHLDPWAFGGVSWFVGAILISGFLYLGNTSHWQRIFSAKNQNVAKRSFYLAIPITAFLGALVLFLGLVAVVKLPVGLQKDTVIFSLMKEILPAWLVGFGFAAILAVIMSSLDSLFVGGSTIIYKAFFGKKNFSSQKEMRYARLLTAVFGLAGFAVAFLIPNIVILSVLVTYLTLIFVPPIFAGIYSRSISDNACFYSILIPTIALLIFFPILKEQSFLITTPLGILLICFYDKLFNLKSCELAE